MSASQKPTTVRRRNTRISFTTMLVIGTLIAVQPSARGAATAANPVLGAPVPSAPADFAPGSYALAPGVVYTTAKIAGPNKIKMLTIDPKVAHVDVALAGPQLPSWATTSSMATASNAVAAVNGDFGLSPGRPAHLFAEDGEMIQTSVLNTDGKNFAVDADGTAAWANNPQVRISATHVADGKVLNIDNWNHGAPRAAEVSAFSAKGGSIEKPGSGCAVRLQPSLAPRWGTTRATVDRDYTVQTVQCGSALAVNGGVVLVAPSGTPNGNDIKAMKNGDVVTLSWGLGWHGIIDAIGGSPVLLHQGNVQVTACSEYLCERHPRTAVGIKANGDIMIFQVDGRTSSSIGLTLVGLANELKKRGVVDAINLDGGGSSTMWIKGTGVVNHPSDGSERAVSSALVVLDHKDPNDPGTLSKMPLFGDVPAYNPVQAADPAAAAQAEMDDPGSTGGMLDYERRH